MDDTPRIVDPREPIVQNGPDPIAQGESLAVIHLLRAPAGSRILVNEIGRLGEHDLVTPETDYRVTVGIAHLSPASQTSRYHRQPIEGERIA